jgi:hypothetical protein
MNPLSITAKHRGFTIASQLYQIVLSINLVLAVGIMITAGGIVVGIAAEEVIGIEVTEAVVDVVIANMISCRK